MREYEPIWNELKKKGRATITAHRAFHPRIIKAVTKEKWMDIGFKLEIEPKKAILNYTTKHSVVTFTLTIYNDLKNIKDHML